MVRQVRFLRPLHFIVTAIKSSMSVLLWTIVILLLSMMLVATMNAALLERFISDPAQDPVARSKVYESWGTFMRALVSMFEITLANWGPQAWLLINNVSELWGFFFIFWRCCFGFAVIQVIASVFIQQTFQVANRDEIIMIKERER